MGGRPNPHGDRMTPPAVALPDRLGRPLRSLRLSVTDRCNLRCRYCMPEADYTWLPRESILTFEELALLARAFASLGVSDVRLTGGEPLLRRELETLVRLLRADLRLRDLALTTNGTLLAEHAASLRDAGLDRVTISLDTLRSERLATLSHTTHHTDILDGIHAATRAGFKTVKLNTVVIRGFNDDELADLVAFARGIRAEPRFIEYMDVGGATRWTREQVVPAAEILERITQACGPAHPLDRGQRGSAPADRFCLADGTTFGIIASVTAPFCETCDRARLTADGTLLLCLYAESGVDLREPLRRGANESELAAIIAAAWRTRNDRGALDRQGLMARGALYPLERLRADPHREMHTRGG